MESMHSLAAILLLTLLWCSRSTTVSGSPGTCGLASSVTEVEVTDSNEFRNAIACARQLTGDTFTIILLKNITLDTAWDNQNVIDVGDSAKVVINGTRAGGRASKISSTVTNRRLFYLQLNTYLSMDNVIITGADHSFQSVCFSLQQCS